MSIKKTISILLSIVIMMTFISGCGKKAHDKDEERITPVEVREIKKGNIENYYTTSGEVIPNNEVKLMPSIQKRAKSVNVNVGDPVKAGDILLEMDNEELEAAMNKAKASLVSAQANLDKAIKGARSQEVEQAKAKLIQAEAAYNTAKQDYKRMQNLYNAEAIAKQQLDLVKLEYVKAESQFKTAQEQLSLVKEGTDTETIKALKAQVEMAKANLKQTQAQLNNSYLISPISGVVAFRNIEPGEMPVMGTPVFTIADMSQVKVKFDVSEEIIKHLNLGDEVKLKVESIGIDKITGTITQLSPMSDYRSKAFPIEVTIKNPPEKLKPGMFAQINIPIERKENVLVIPKEALLEEKEGKYVYLAKNKVARKTKIRTGIEDENDIEVLEGIKEGDLVIISAANLKDKEKISVVRRGNDK